MGIFFKPNGSLDIATDPSDLPEKSDGSTIASEALARCKNLRVDRKGFVQTRDGSSKVTETTLAAAPSLIVEQAGNRYEFAGTVIYRNETSIATGLTNAQWSAIKYNSFNDTTQNIFALNGTDRKRIEGSSVYEWGMAAPSAPTTAVGALTGLTGAYNAKVTYCRKVGSTVVYESNPSDAGTSRTLSNESLSVTWTASSDSQVTHVRVYRTASGGSLYLHDQDVAIGTTTLDTNTADGSLGDEVESDHDRPPLGQYVSGPTYDGTSFIVKDNSLHYSKTKRPEYWPTSHSIEVSTPQFVGKCPVIFFNGQPYFLTAVEIYLIGGTGHGTFFPYPMKAKTGTLSPFGALSVHGIGIFHVGDDGIYLFSSGNDRKFTESNFDPIFRNESVNGVPGVSDVTNCWLLDYQNKLYFGYTSTGNTYPTNILVFNFDTGRAHYYTYNDGSDIQIRTTARDDTNKRILAGDSGGYIRVLENRSVTTDSGTAITFDVESKDFNLQTRAHFPRQIKYDIDASSAVTCAGSVILDDVTLQSHTITGSRDTRYRLVTVGNGKRLSLRVNGTGVVKIYAIEGE